MIKYLFICFFLKLHAGLWCGIGSVDITPEIGATSAGYAARQGQGMVAIRDPLLASATVVETENCQIAWCGVDHLGMTTDMVKEVRRRLDFDGLVLISSSHTHSGAGGFLPFGGWAEALAGPFDPMLREQVIAGCVEAIEGALSHLEPARLGVGVSALACHRSRSSFEPSHQLTLIKVESESGAPLAALFFWPCHPTCFGPDNLAFSADFVADARSQIAQIGALPIYINGAQGDVLPDESDVGAQLGAAVVELWMKTETSDAISLSYLHHPYSFPVLPTCQGLKLPVELWQTETNLVKIDSHLFVTVGGEMSSAYAPLLPATICGLTCDAHGYIVTPKTWHSNCTEARTSFGGPEYGSRLVKLLQELIDSLE